MSGGGSIVQNNDGSVTYTAPASNAGCTNNSTLTVIDHCGEIASMQIAINCYAPADTALAICTQVQCWCYKLDNPDCLGVPYEGQYRLHAQSWACNDAVLMDVWWLGLSQCTASGRPPCTGPCACQASNDDACWNCDTACNNYSGFTPCNTLLDKRTVAMKNAGWNTKKFLIDGFPRGEENREGWERLMAPEVDVKFILFLECSEEIMIERIQGRSK